MLIPNKKHLIGAFINIPPRWLIILTMNFLILLSLGSELKTNRDGDFNLKFIKYLQNGGKSVSRRPDNCVSGNITTHISDHLLLKQSPTTRFRDYKNFNEDAFNTEIDDLD